MILAIIASVALSLVSTNDYRYVHPGTTNIVGKGIGKFGSCLVPRAEDSAFIMEAYTERAKKLGMSRSFDRTNSLAIVERRFNSSGIARGLVHSLFRPSFGEWNRGAYDNNAYLVKPEVTWPQNDFWQTDGRYLVGGSSTDPTNGVSAFMSFGDFAHASSDVITNINFVGALTRRAVTNAYSNLELASGVLDTCDGQYEPAYVASRFISRIIRESDVFTLTGATPYTYKIDDHTTVNGYYYTGYTVARDVGDYATTNATDRQTVNLYKRYIRMRWQPVTFRRNDYTASRRYTALSCGDPFDTRLQMTDYLYQGGPMRLSTFCLITNEVSNATCMAVIRFRSVMQETFSGRTTRTGSSVTNWFVGTLRGTVTRLPEEPTKWETDMDIVNAVWQICDAEPWINQVAAAEVDFTSGEQTDYTYSHPYAGAERSVRIYNLEVFPYIHFKPKFNARIIQE